MTVHAKADYLIDWSGAGVFGGEIVAAERPSSVTAV